MQIVDNYGFKHEHICQYFNVQIRFDWQNPNVHLSAILIFNAQAEGEIHPRLMLGV
jgi:hypothetical protein